jgi:hypothetical protein
MVPEDLAAEDFRGDRHLGLWSEVPAPLPASEAVPQALGRKASDVFPMSFVSQVPVDGTLVSGTIDISGALPNQALQLTVNLPPLGRSDDRR